MGFRNSGTTRREFAAANSALAAASATQISPVIMQIFGNRQPAQHGLEEARDLARPYTELSFSRHRGLGSLLRLGKHISGQLREALADHGAGLAEQEVQEHAGTPVPVFGDGPIGTAW